MVDWVGDCHVKIQIVNTYVHILFFLLGLFNYLGYTLTNLPKLLKVTAKPYRKLSTSSILLEFTCYC